MATQEQITQIAGIFRRLRPAPFLKEINEANAGIGAVMGLLDEAGDGITAGQIAARAGVSTARVAVLLKKMTAKGLILRERDPSDARVTIVRLSDQGRQVADSMREHMFRKVGEVIDQVGYERVLEFFAIVQEIAQIVPPQCDPFEECM